LLGALLLAGICLGSAATAGEADGAREAPEPQFKALSGMSVLGNNEAPKSLVIVPWKSSQIGDGIGVKNSLDNRPLPVDRDVFARELGYYRIRTEAPSVAPAASEGIAVGRR
jgi:hypothetical protein